MYARQKEKGDPGAAGEVKKRRSRHREAARRLNSVVLRKQEVTNGPSTGGTSNTNQKQKRERESHVHFEEKGACSPKEHL